MTVSEISLQTKEAKTAIDFSGISIVIAYYNDESTTPQCLKAIGRAWENLDAMRKSQVEVILVDDHSPRPFKIESWDFVFRVHRLENNSGVGFVRNAGSQLARFSHVLFVDSDVLLLPDYLEYAFRRLESEPGIKVIQGPFAKEPANENASMYQRFMALSWYQRSALSTSGQNARRFLSSGCSIFNNAFFKSIGGFVSTYRGSGGEEFEIVSRIPVGAIVNDDKLLCFHYYDDFFTRVKKAFQRGLNYRRTVGSNRNIPLSFKVFSGIKALCSVAMTACMALAFYHVGLAVMVYLALCVLYSLADAKLLIFTLKNGGLAMAAASLVFSQAEYTAIAVAMFLDLLGWNNNVQQF